ncbi:MAG TPA: hypothetical protein VFY05_09240 [Candidatus Angelobacter sp.]|nr:hypothetical protein [Candidatus Angelobacter sp.]
MIGITGVLPGSAHIDLSGPGHDAAARTTTGVEEHKIALARREGKASRDLILSYHLHRVTAVAVRCYTK